MKQIKFLTVLMVFVFAGFVSFGQGITFGVKGGINSSTVTGDNDGIKSKFGYDFGIYGESALNDKFSVQVALMNSNKGAKYDFYDEDSEETFSETLNLNYIEVVPTLVYNSNSDKIGFYANVGAYIAPFSYGDNDGLKKGDFGLNLGAGVDLKSAGRIGLQYEMGLSNLSKEDDYTWKNSSFALVYSYPLNFGKKSK